MFSKKLIILLSIFSFSEIFSQNKLNDTAQKISSVTIIGNRSKSIAGSGEVISHCTLLKLNEPNINNVLRSVPGVNIRDEEGYGLRPNIGMRGTQVNRSAKITLMEDAILIAPAPYADPAAYYFPSFNRIHSVEVLKGSSQIAHGPYTIGGAINLVSTPIPTSFRGYAQLGFGSFMTNTQRVWVGDSKKNFDYLFELNRLASNGFKQLDNGGNTGFDRRDMMAKFRWHTDMDSKIYQSISLKAINTTEDSRETYLGLTLDDYQKNPFRRYSATQNDLLDMNHQHLFLQHLIKPTKGLEIKTTGYLGRVYRDWARANRINGVSLMNIISNPTANLSAYKTMVGDSNGTIDYQSAARTYLSRGIQLQTNYEFQTKEIGHRLELGFRFHNDNADRFATSDNYSMKDGKMILIQAGVRGNQENQIRNATSWAGNLAYHLKYKGLTIIPGIRLEHILLNIKNYGVKDNARIGTEIKEAENTVTIALPGIGVNYEINEKMNIFGGIHKGFSPPGMPSTLIDTAQAQSETAINYELGFRYNSSIIHLNTAFFWNNYQNILGSDAVSGGGAGTGNMFNAGEAQTFGWEFSTDFDLLKVIKFKSEYTIPIRLAYTFTRAYFSGKDSFRNGGGDWGSGIIYKNDEIPFITPHQFSFSVGVGHKKFNTTLSGRYIGITRTKPGQGELFTPSHDISYNSVNAILSFLILDLSANYAFNHILSVYSTLGNLTNNKAIIANLPQGYRPNMPINLNVGIKVDF